METNSLQRKRAPYEKPELTVIDYSAEEVMVVGCKTAGGGTSKQPGPGCRLTNCFQVGS